MHASGMPEGQATHAHVRNCEDASGSLSKRKQKKLARRPVKVAGSVDAMVQHTNDDSVVSKRSAVFCGYLEDPYLRMFVQKKARRAPLINRGYYLRMVAMTDVVVRAVRYLVSRHEDKRVQVISLGAGYDTLAMRLLNGVDASYYHKHVFFYDVDFPAVAQSKAALMKATPPETLPNDWMCDPTNAQAPVRNPNYHLLGVDLRERDQVLLRVLSDSDPAFGADYPTVIYAECVMQYMPPDDSTALVRYISTTFRNSIFAAYDQLHPSDSFGSVMLRALKQKSCPLLGIQQFSDPRSMLQRMSEAGMANASFANFFDLSRFYICGEERDRVEALETFDEMEEWSEMCEHYGITLATTTASYSEWCVSHPSFKQIGHWMRDDIPLESVPATACEWPTGRHNFEGWGNGEAYAERVSDRDVVVISFGGYVVGKQPQRVNTVLACSLHGGPLKVQSTSPVSEVPPALVFHSFSRLSPFRYVVLGGRTNPTYVSQEVFLASVSVHEARDATLSVTVLWQKMRITTERPEPRYRHAATSTSERNIFIFGGRTGTGRLLQDAWTAQVDTEAKTISWLPLELTGCVPPPLCSAAAALSRPGKEVLLSGGLLEDERCTGHIWRIHLETGLCQVVECLDIGPRFSHTMTLVPVDGKDMLLVLGGSVDASKESIENALLVEFPSLASVKRVTLPEGCASWSRHSCMALGDGTVAILGGGYTCFSFGTYTAKPCLLLLGSNTAGVDRWRTGCRNTNPLSFFDDAPSRCISSSLLTVPRSVEIRTYSAEAFAEVAKASITPVHFRKVDLGSCVQEWNDPSYLKRAEGGTVVSVHISETSHLLDFVRRNFSYRHVTFAELVQHTMESVSHHQADGRCPPSTWYYRSIAASTKTARANFWKDFPHLGRDFTLPLGAREYIMPRVHQSCFRMSAPPLQLWIHYDTLDNVLCQVVGRKRVILFPPSEYNNLYMTGSSSAVLNLDALDVARYPRMVDAFKQAIEVIIEPGDMLYIPALWFHHITTLDGSFSISVNVFFYRFHVDDYEPKDIYGNKDIPAGVTLRQNIVSHVQQLLGESGSVRQVASGETLPPEYVEFSLREAIQDLEQIADSMAAARAAERDIFAAKST